MQGPRISSLFIEKCCHFATIIKEEEEEEEEEKVSLVWKPVLHREQIRWQVVRGHTSFCDMVYLEIFAVEEVEERSSFSPMEVFGMPKIWIHYELCPISEI